jgi:hypothetical protein
MQLSPPQRKQLLDLTVLALILIAGLAFIAGALMVLYVMVVEGPSVVSNWLDQHQTYVSGGFLAILMIGGLASAPYHPKCGFIANLGIRLLSVTYFLLWLFIGIKVIAVSWLFKPVFASVFIAMFLIYFKAINKLQLDWPREF